MSLSDENRALVAQTLLSGKSRANGTRFICEQHELNRLLEAARAEERAKADTVGAAEAEVGRYVYRRIEALMDAKPGTPEAAELDYLAKVAESVEEYGEEACQGHALAPFADDVNALRSELSELRALVREAGNALESCKGEQHEFEAWAHRHHYDMAEHPLHYLFTDQRTNAARQGWKAGVAHARALLPRLSETAEPGSKSGEGSEP